MGPQFMPSQQMIGCTRTAPPPAEVSPGDAGAAGAADTACIALVGPLSPPTPPTTNATAATPPHSAARVLVLRLVIVPKCTSLPGNSPGPVHRPKHTGNGRWCPYHYRIRSAPVGTGDIRHE
jgi:hypothetical protein